MNLASTLLCTLLLATPPQDSVHMRHPEPAAGAANRAKEPAAAEREKPAQAEEKPVVSRHLITVNGKPLRYTATAGTLPIANPGGETEASMFYVAYTADTGEKSAERPLVFAFNGGPGSSSVWLHLGAMGPRRVELADDGSMPSPPFRLADNAETWLDQADLVFIDPVGTGFSRAAKPDLASKFSSLQGDLDSVGEFIRLYLTRNERWSSPLFLAGESYGTTRAAGVAGRLVDKGIVFNGLILVSSVLNFSTISFAPGNDLPYAFFLPTYSATAWHHRKLAPEPGRDLAATLAEVEQWAATGYLQALGKGDRLPPAERRDIITKLSRYTGLEERYIDNCNLRIDAQHFSKELLRERRRTTGRFDARITGTDIFAAGEQPDFDPSLAAVRPPFTAAFNGYVGGELGYKTDREYYILGGGIGRWDWGTNNSYVDTSDELRSAMAKNPFMQVFVASGLYDLATPYLGTEYTLDHLGLEPAERQRVTVRRYDAGHMLYTDSRCRARLKEDVGLFVGRAAGSARRPQ
jgi:carboxypeptidase C (cathepsin A)